MDKVIANQLSKVYAKGKTAVDKVSFSVKEGELFGLIGPDGAGKSSIFRMLTTLLLPDHGSATVNGFDVVQDYKAIRKTIGYMPGKFSLYPDLSVEENLNFFAAIFNTTIEENYHLIKDIYVQIAPFKTRRAGKLSGGMKQKLALCCALIHKPSVLLLDEPTTGVDPVSRKEFWQMLHQLKLQGITILVSTPYMDEASLCDRIALIQNGHILSVDTPLNIVNAYPDKLYAVTGSNMPHLLKLINQDEQVLSAYSFGENIHVTLKNNDTNIDEVTAFWAGHGIENIVAKPAQATIEDSFIKLLKD